MRARSVTGARAPFLVSQAVGAELAPAAGQALATASSSETAGWTPMARAQAIISSCGARGRGLTLPSSNSVNRRPERRPKSDDGPYS